MRTWRNVAKLTPAALLAAVLTLALAPIVFAQGAPVLPIQVYGSVTVAGSPASNGTPVSARLESGATIMTTTTSSGIYDFYVPGDSDGTLEIEGAADGQTVFLYVGDVFTNTVTFKSGRAAPRNLVVLASQALTVSISSITPASPRAGIDSVLVSGQVRNRANNSVSNAQVVVDWGDGSASTTVSSDAGGNYSALKSASYATPNAYTVRATASKANHLGASASQALTVATPVATSTPSPTPSPTPTATSTPSPGPIFQQPTATPVATSTPSPTPSPTPTATSTPSPTPSPTPTATGTVTATATPVRTAVPTPVGTVVATTTPQPTAIPTPRPLVTAVPTPTPVPVSGALTFSELSIEPGTVALGVPVTVSVRVTNPTDRPETYNVQLFVNGTPEQSLTGTLSPGASRVLSSTVLRIQAGTYTISLGGLGGQFIVQGAVIALQDLEVTPRTVGRGDTVSISAFVVNNGRGPGDYQFDFLVNGARIDSASGTVLPGRRAPLLFTASRQEPGSYSVSLGPLSSSFTVLAPAVEARLETRVAISSEARGAAVDAAGNVIQVQVAPGGTTELSDDRIQLPLQLPPGANLQNFQDPVSGVRVEGNNVIMPIKDGQGNTQVEIVVETAGLSGTGTAATGTVRGLSLRSKVQEVDLSADNAVVGRVAVTVQANLNRLPPGASVTMAPKVTLPANARAGFELIAQAQNGTIASVGAALEVVTQNLPNGAQGVGRVTVCMAVGQAWVQQNVGATLRFAHLTTDAAGNPRQEFLTAVRQAQPDSEGRAVFCAESEGFSFFALMAVQAVPATFAVQNLVIDPAVAAPGEVVNISAEVTNSGTQSGTISVALKINGQAAATKSVTVGPNGRETVQFLQKPEVEGTYAVEVAKLSGSFLVLQRLRATDIQVRNLSVSPPEVEPGRPVTISFDLQNTTGRQGKFDARLLINGVSEAVQAIDLPAGGTKRVSFQVSRDTQGTYQAAVEGQASSFTVRRPQQPATFVVTDLTVQPSQVAAGGTVQIVATVENTGDVAGTYAATLELQDPSGTVARELLRQTIEPKTRARIIVTKTVQAEGTYQVRLSDKRISFAVVPAGLITPVGTAAPGVTPTPEARTGLSPAVLGVIGVLVLIVIGGAAFFLLRGRRGA